MSVDEGENVDCVEKQHVRTVFIASSVGPASRRVGVICSALLTGYNLLIVAVQCTYALAGLITSTTGHLHCWRLLIVVNQVRVIVARGLYIP